jgi:hypothetical protein
MGHVNLNYSFVVDLNYVNFYKNNFTKTSYVILIANIMLIKARGPPLW